MKARTGTGSFERGPATSRGGGFRRPDGPRKGDPVLRDRSSSSAASDWKRRVGPAQRFPTGSTPDGVRTFDSKSGRDARTRISLDRNDGRRPGFSFYRDDDRDFFTGSIALGDRRLSFTHRGDDFYRRYHGHWLFGRDCRFGYRYPHWRFSGHWPYRGYRYCSPYYSSIYHPHYHYYDPFWNWYYVPSYGYSYVSVYYSDPYPDVVYRAEPYVSEYVDGGYAAYDTYPSSDSTVIYNAENVYVDDDASGTVINERSYDSEQVTSDGGVLTEVPVGQGAAGAAPDEDVEVGWGPILSEGNDAFAAGNYEEARRHYARAVLDDPADGYAKMLSGWASFALGDYGDAAATIRTAIETSPDLAQYPIDVRILFKDEDTFEAEVVELRRYVADRPEDSSALFVLGYLHYSIGEPDEALSVLNRLETSGPGGRTIEQLREGALRGQEILKERAKLPPPTEEPN